MAHRVRIVSPIDKHRLQRFLKKRISSGSGTSQFYVYRSSKVITVGPLFSRIDSSECMPTTSSVPSWRACNIAPAWPSRKSVDSAWRDTEGIRMQPTMVEEIPAAIYPDPAIKYLRSSLAKRTVRLRFAGVVHVVDGNDGEGRASPRGFHKAKKLG